MGPQKLLKWIRTLLQFSFSWGLYCTLRQNYSSCSNFHLKLFLTMLSRIRSYIILIHILFNHFIRYNWHTESCTYLMYTTWWICRSAHICENIITVYVINIFITLKSCLLLSLTFFLCVIRTLNVRSTLSENFKVYNTVFLTIGSMLHDQSLDLTHLV